MAHLWSQGFGDATDSQYAARVATDAAGNVIVSGLVHGTIDLGGGVLTATGTRDIFLAKYAPDGSHIWSQIFPGTDIALVEGTRVDASGNIIIAGFYRGSIDFGGGALASAGDNDIFLAKYDPNGNHLWSRRFGDSDTQRAYELAVDAAGNVYVTGWFSGIVSFGGMLISSNWVDVWLAKYDPSGNHLWSKGFGDSGGQAAYGAAVDPSGNVFITGTYDGTIDFGGGPMTYVGYADIFLAKFDTNGNHLWSQSYGDVNHQEAIDLATDSAGNILVTGRNSGTVNFGGGPLTSAGSYDIILAKLAPNGTHLWSTIFGDGADQRGYAVATDPSDNIFLTCYGNGTMDFGGGPLTSTGSADMPAVKLSPTGVHIWSQLYGDTQLQYAVDIETDVSGNAFFVGGNYGTADFGGGPITSAGSSDVVMVAFKIDETVPAALRSLRSYWTGREVEVTWRLVGVDGELSFEVARARETGRFEQIFDAQVIERDDEFVFVDPATEPGTTYRYQVVVFENGHAVTSFETSLTTPSARLSLGQNHPNPFNPVTHIPFVIDEAGHVALGVYDISGRLVRNLIDRPMRAGNHAEEWNGRDANGNAVASGVYFYRLTAGGRTLMRKAVLLK
jgi:hypothetical protein